MTPKQWIFLGAMKMALIAVASCSGSDDAATSQTFEGSDGAELYAAACAECHGADLQGTDQGPPFLHQVYEPGHHGDASFYRAAAQGVRAHHWRFGNMPPVEGVSRRDVSKITAYVRELQRANGIN